MSKEVAVKTITLILRCFGCLHFSQVFVINKIFSSSTVIDFITSHLVYDNDIQKDSVDNTIN